MLLLSEKPRLNISFPRPGVDKPPRSARLQPIAAYGGFPVGLDWPALTPALTEIRLFAPFGGLEASRQRNVPRE